MFLVHVTMLVSILLRFSVQPVHAFSPLFREFSVLRKVAAKLQMKSTLNNPVRVRFAPSPTGSLHVGGARTALFNWLFAKKNNGKFIIRVEDTDEARSTRQSEESILNDLKWMNLNWDEGPGIGGPCEPYRQSERKDLYKKYAEQLISEGYAYKCFCSEEELDMKRKEAEDANLVWKYDGKWRNASPEEIQSKLDNNEPYSVRFKVPPNKIVYIDDVVRGRVTWDAEGMLGDFIILRSNGMPVYNFCVAVDDATMGITHVIRAEEHLSNTLRQLLVLEALKYKPPTYAHCSLILGSDRSKLSKRHGATSVKQFSEQGFLPNAMMNYLATLGWNDGTQKEIYSPQELANAFDMTRIVPAAAVFDINKLKWVNGQHIRLMKIDELQPLVLADLQKPHGDIPSIVLDSIDVNANSKFLAMATKIAQRDVELISESSHYVGKCLQYNLQKTITEDPHVLDVLNDDLAKIVFALKRDFDSNVLPSGHEESFNDLWKAYVKKLGKDLGLKGKNLFHPLRFAITGQMSGPELSEIVQLVVFAQGVTNPLFPCVSMKSRIEQISMLSIADARIAAEAAAKERASTLPLQS